MFLDYRVGKIEQLIELSINITREIYMTVVV